MRIALSRSYQAKISDDECIANCKVLTGLHNSQAPAVTSLPLCNFFGKGSVIDLKDYRETNEFYASLVNIAMREELDASLDTLRIDIDKKAVTLSSRCGATVTKNEKDVLPSACAAVCHILEDVCDDNCFTHLQFWDIFTCTFEKAKTLSVHNCLFTKAATSQP